MSDTVGRAKLYTRDDLDDLLVAAMESLARLAKVLNELDDKRAAEIKALDKRIRELEAIPNGN